jgi:predicted nucleotidyltransferase component of viral defense system
VLNLEKSEAVKLEAASLNDLLKIELEAKRFGIDLVLIGGYAVRAYTNQRSWRFTKDMDFITTRKDLTALRGVFKVLGYSFEKTEFGVKGRKKINENDIKLDIAVDKVIDWSSGKEYALPADVFKKYNLMDIVESHEENKGLGAKIAVAPIEDMILMKLMTERSRDHFDAIAMIIDSFDKIDLLRFAKICKESGLRSHIRDRLESVLADIKRGFTKKLWREQTGREFIREQEVTLKERVNMLREANSS